MYSTKPGTSKDTQIRYQTWEIQRHTVTALNPGNPGTHSYSCKPVNPISPQSQNQSQGTHTRTVTAPNSDNPESQGYSTEPIVPRNIRLQHQTGNLRNAQLHVQHQIRAIQRCTFTAVNPWIPYTLQHQAPATPADCSDWRTATGPKPGNSRDAQQKDKTRATQRNATIAVNISNPETYR